MPVCIMHQTLEKYRVITNYKENRIQYFLVSVTDDLEKDTEEQ